MIKPADYEDLSRCVIELKRMLSGLNQKVKARIAKR
jgi:hypothetical protein